jgi:hypothetical protein
MFTQKQDRSRRNRTTKRPNRNRRQNSRRNTRRNSDKSRLVKLIAAPIAVASIGGFALYHYLGIEQPDALGCYTRTDQHQAVVFVDNSVLNESGAHFRDYKTGMLRVYDNAPANSLIKITTTSRSEGGSFAQAAHVICKPASTKAEQASIGAPDQPSQYLKNIADAAAANYKAIVDQVIADARDPAKAAKDSPILEQIQAISRYDDFEGPNRSLTVISDFIQNTEFARFCSVKGHMPSFETFKKRPDYRHIAPNSFEGVDVTFLMVEYGKLPFGSYNYCTHTEFYNWWEAYALGNGADS